MSTIVTTRRARKMHTCSRCNLIIHRGELYASSSLPPGGELGYTGWMHATSHVSAWLPEGRAATRADHARLGIGCDEAAAYLENAQREDAAACTECGGESATCRTPDYCGGVTR
jgi:hypothetical protein